MVISAKLVDVGGLKYAVSEENDTINVNGDTDIINAVGAETAKFSGGGTMQANPGLRIGIVQLRLKTAAVVARSGVVISGAYSTNNSTVVVDFGNIGTADIRANVRHATNASSASTLAVSDDDISYTNVSSVVTGTDTSFTHLGGVQTFRYARMTPGGFNPALLTFLIFEIALVSTATYNIRSSTTIDTANGSILESGTIDSTGPDQTFNTDLILTGDGEFLTLEIVSFSASAFDVNLLNITSLKEV